ncbi:C-terminal binding protein [Gordonia desulfuricans]|uniref:C-terminal binding protein n=1 Tax=Gordonia desulfuricans TaxID=89051 RepID=A0A7K3LPH3_9ACTN|nr:C-terminal binding protein [Gordonia desulfuricans]NDK90133.1 C-terminal binding protein [Gordonia desulfuricans]
MTAVDSRPLAVYTDIVDTDPRPGIDILERSGVATRVIGSADPEVIAREGAGAHALLLGYSPITVEILDALPDVKIVAAQSVGTDMIDVDACRERGIWVTNVAGVATQEVAGHALALTLALARGIVALDNDVRAGQWDGTTVPMRRLSNLTVGVVGLGRIGAAYASMVGPLVEGVVGYDPMGSADGVEQCTLDEVFERADVVSLHLPSTPETDGLVDARRLGLMKPGSMLVNVSRGSLIDEQAVLDALDSGRLAGAGLDVLAEEPPNPDHRLIRHARTVVTPHAAYISEATMDAYVEVQARNVALVLTGDDPTHVVLEGTRGRTNR